MIDPARVLMDRLHRPAEITADEVWRWPMGALDLLVRDGVLVRGETARTVICEHCDEGCWVEPRVRRLPKRGPTLVHPCIGSAMAGLLTFKPDRLNTWQLGVGALARVIAHGLGLVGVPEQRVPRRVWWLGERRPERRRDVYLVAGIGLDAEAADDATVAAVQGLAPIVLLPWGTAMELAAEVVPLHDLVSVGSAGIGVDRERFDGRLLPPRTRKTPVRPFALPDGAVWERLVVEVFDREHVRLRYGDREETRTYIEFGFMDGRSKATNPKPSELWTYFLGLAADDGRITWQSASATPKLRDRVRELREKLAEVFPIVEGTPIADYAQRKAYETTFTLRRR